MKPGLGCLPDLPDQRDYSFSFKVGVPEELQPSFHWILPIPIYNQGSIGSCTGHGIGRAYRALLLHQKLPVFQPSRLFIYYAERFMENTVNSDSGAQIRNGMKVITKIGVADEVLWNYIPSYFKARPSPRAFKNALDVNHQALEYLRLSNNLSEVKHAIQFTGPVVLGFAVYSSFYDIRMDGKMPLAAGSLEGGHCVTVEGWDDDTQRFLCVNSWGGNWGDKGRFYMPYSFLQNPEMVFDLWSIQKI